LGVLSIADFSFLGFALCFLCGGPCRTKKQMLFLDAPLRMAVRAVKGGGVSRSSERSEDPLQEKRTEQAHALRRKSNLNLLRDFYEIGLKLQAVVLYV
jgi:hypothetical protein